MSTLCNVHLEKMEIMLAPDTLFVGLCSRLAIDEMVGRWTLDQEGPGSNRKGSPYLFPLPFVISILMT